MLRVFRNGKGPASDVANSHIGAVAQSGEHLLCKQGVRGSNPLSSTSSRPRCAVDSTNCQAYDVKHSITLTSNN